MKPYKRELSGGKVSPYQKRGQWRWRATVSAYTTTEAVDDGGKPILLENGQPKLDRKRQVLSVTLDVPCTPYKGRKGEQRFRNEAKAREAFNEWRDGLVSKAEEDYQRELAICEEAERGRAFSYSTMSVEGFLDSYLEERAESVEKSTMSRYRFAAKKVADFFADKLVGDLTEDDLKDFDASMREQGLSGNTRQKSLAILKYAFDAHKEQIGCYPFTNYKQWAPRPEKADPNPLDTASIRKVLDDLANAPATGFMCAVGLAMYTGMRVGEICALRWSDVSLKTGDITVCSAIGRIVGSTELYMKGPKDTRRKRPGESSTVSRSIPGTVDIRALLLRRLDHMTEEAMARSSFKLVEEARAYVLDHCYVVGKTDGSYANPTVMGRTWSGYAQTLTGTERRRPTFHTLRHTWTSRAITEAGVDPITAAKITGHADPGFLMRTYGNSDRDTMKSAQVALSGCYASISGGGRSEKR